MKKIKYYMTFSFLPLLFLARGCVKDSEEVYDENFMEVTYTDKDVVTKDMAIENWELFLKQSQELFEISETNIGSVEAKMEDTDEPEKTALQKLCNDSNLKLLKLKASRIKRNKEFTGELENYDSDDQSIQQANEAYKKQFKRDIFDLNIAIENVLEKPR